MPVEEQEPFLCASPSFRDPLPTIDPDSPQRISAAESVDRAVDPNDGADSNSDFEFAFVPCDPAVTADEIFSNGVIRPIYPVFDRSLLEVCPPPPPPPPKPVRVPLRRLLSEERDESSSASSEGDELEGLEPGTYCMWAPSPDRRRACQKSRSMGSTGSLWRWRLKDLVVRRAQSDGKERFGFIASGEDKRKQEKRALPLPPPQPAAEKKKGGKVTAGKEVKLPIPEVVGFFPGVNEIGRALSPF